MALASLEMNDNKRLIPGLANSVDIGTSYDATQIPKFHAYRTPYISDRSYVTAASQLVQPLQELPESSTSTLATPTPNLDILRHPGGEAREVRWRRDGRLSLTPPLDILPTKSTTTRPATLGIDLRNGHNAGYDLMDVGGVKDTDVKGKGKMTPWQAENDELEEAIDMDTKAPTIYVPTTSLGKGYYQDYFSSKSVVLPKATDVKAQPHDVPFSTLQPLPLSSFASTSLRPQDSSASGSTWAIGGPSRPGVGTGVGIGIVSTSSIYKHTSRSMSDFPTPLEEEPSQSCSSRVGQPAVDDADPTPPPLPRGKRKYYISKPPPYQAVVEVHPTEPKEIYLPKPPSPRRHTLPTFNSTTDPPPYPLLFPHYSILIEPRDDEGRERLPQYINHIFMSAVVSMKMEFRSAGVLAGDRRWRKVVCVLEGTSFKVYKYQPVAHGSIIGDWWRKSRVARTTGGPSASPVNIASGCQVNEASELLTKSILCPFASLIKLWHARTRAEGEIPSNSTSPSSSTTPTSRPFLTASSASDRSSGSDSGSGEHTPHLSMPNFVNAPTSSNGTTTSSYLVANDRVSPSPSDIPNFLPNEYPFKTPTTIFGIGTASRSGPSQPPPETGELLKTYSMQGAQSGIAYDYFKRRNVVRACLEGEQFLMHTSGMVEMNAWIEALQSAADVALDLDERPMPRRRRRFLPRRRIIDVPPEVTVL